MNINLKKPLLWTITLGLLAGTPSAAFADDWLTTLFGTQNQNNNTTSQNQGQLQQDQSDLNGLSEAMARTRQDITNHGQGLAQARQKLLQDQRTGADQAADRRAIQEYEQGLRQDRLVYQQQAQNYQMKNAQVVQNGGVSSPLTNITPGNYRANRPWQPNTQWQSGSQRPWHGHEHHRGYYDNGR